MEAEGITNVYIDSILKSCSYYRGIYSCDTIPKNLCDIDHFGIVCNLSKEEETGTHFISIIVFPKYVFYIDSLSGTCLNPDINKFLASLQKPVFFNSKTIQSPSSLFCGFFAILFILYFEAYRNFKLQFDSELNNNDKICIKYLCTLLANK